VDAVVADNGVVVSYVANNAGTKFKTVTDASFVPEQYGIAVKKGNIALVEQLNKGLAGIKADGTYERLYAKYFGAVPQSSSPASAPAK
jgi:polar amino acid transport system substrate-binding protein